MVLPEIFNSKSLKTVILEIPETRLPMDESIKDVLIHAIRDTSIETLSLRGDALKRVGFYDLLECVVLGLTIGSSIQNLFIQPRGQHVGERSQTIMIKNIPFMGKLRKLHFHWNTDRLDELIASLRRNLSLQDIWMISYGELGNGQERFEIAQERCGRVFTRNRLYQEAKDFKAKHDAKDWVGLWGKITLFAKNPPDVSGTALFTIPRQSAPSHIGSGRTNRGTIRGHIPADDE